MTPSQQAQANISSNNAAAINGMPVGAGQQMDVNFLYQKVIELSEILKENREKTAGIVAGAEELAVSISSSVPRSLVTISFLSRLVQPQMGQHPLFKKQMQKFLVSEEIQQIRLNNGT